MLLWLSAFVGIAAAAEDFNGYRFYLGDLHVHTGVSGDGCSADLDGSSEGCGDYADLIWTARANGLDFFVSTDHANGMHSSRPGAWADLRDRVLEANDPDSGFVTLLGAELVLQQEAGTALGHKTLIFFGADEDLRGVDPTDLWVGGDSDDEIGACEVLWSWAEGLEDRAGPLLLVPHHPAMIQPMVNEWWCHDERFSPVVEVYSRHGDSMGGGSSYDPSWSGVRERNTVTWAMHPDGFDLPLGFAAGTDSHDTSPGAVCALDRHHDNLPYGGGLTVVMTEADVTFGRAAIYEALTTRRSYATSGPMVPVVLTWLSGGARLGGLGDELALPDGQALDVRVAMPARAGGAVRAVSLVGPDGSVPMAEQEDGLWRGRLEPEEVGAWHYVDVTLDGQAWYGPDGCEDGGEDDAEHLWLSPSRVVSGPGDLDADGFTVAEGDCDDGDDARSPAVLEDCLGGVDEDCDGLTDHWDEDCVVADPPVERSSADVLSDEPRPANLAPRADDERAPDLVPIPAGCASAPGGGPFAALLSMIALAACARRRQ